MAMSVTLKPECTYIRLHGATPQKNRIFGVMFIFVCDRDFFPRIHFRKYSISQKLYQNKQKNIISADIFQWIISCILFSYPYWFSFIIWYRQFWPLTRYHLICVLFFNCSIFGDRQYLLFAFYFDAIEYFAVPFLQVMAHLSQCEVVHDSCKRRVRTERTLFGDSSRPCSAGWWTSGQLFACSWRDAI